MSAGPIERAAIPTFGLSGKRVVAVGGKVGKGFGITRAAHAAGAAVTVAS